MSRARTALRIPGFMLFRCTVVKLTFDFTLTISKAAGLFHSLSFSLITEVFNTCKWKETCESKESLPGLQRTEMEKTEV